MSQTATLCFLWPDSSSTRKSRTADLGRAVALITVPPLRDRLDDLPGLCRQLLRPLAPNVQVVDDGLVALRNYSWPGNVRELRLVLLRALMDAKEGATALTHADLTRAIQSIALPPGQVSISLPCNLRRELKRLEVQTMRTALRQAGDRASEAGRLVGLKWNAHNFQRNMEKAIAALRKLEETDERD